MSTDLDRQLARFAQALDREAPPISFEDIVSRGTIAADVDLLERPSSARASHSEGVPWVDTTPSHDTSGERDVLIELDPSVSARRPDRRRVAWKLALGVAAAAVLIVTLTAIERDSDDRDPVVDLPSLTTTFVSPRNGFSMKHPDRAAITPATQLWAFSGRNDDGYDVVQIDSAAVFKGTSTSLTMKTTVGSIDAWADEYLLSEYVLPGGCGVPRNQQAEITIDGRPGRVAECSDHIEATVVVPNDLGGVGGRLYLFTLSHDRSDARAVFDAFVDTIDLTPHTAVDLPADTVVSPTYGYSFEYSRGSFAPARELWDPSNQPAEILDFDPRLDGFETGYAAYFVAASTPIPDGASIDAWVDEYVTPRAAGGCRIPRSQQAEITIDGQPGRVAECGRLEVTVVAGGRLYLFIGFGDRARAHAWIGSIDLTPETAAT